MLQSSDELKRRPQYVSGEPDRGRNGQDRQGPAEGAAFPLTGRGGGGQSGAFWR